MNDLFKFIILLAVYPYRRLFFVCRRCPISSYYRRQKKVVCKYLKIRVNCIFTYRKKSSIIYNVLTLCSFIFNNYLTQIFCIISIIGLSLHCHKNRNSSVRLNFFHYG